MALVVSLIARTSAFDKGMRRGAKGINHFSDRVAATNRRIAGFAKGLVALALTGGLALLIKRTMDSIDATGKFADRIGITTEALIGLRHAASIMGVETAGLDKALETFVRRIGEVNMGVGQAKYALDAMGLSARQLEQQSPDENFKDIADSISKMNSAAEKASAAYYLFGRQGVQLLNILNLGRSGIEKLEAEAKKLGITFSRFDAARVEAANDALNRLKKVFTGAFQRVVIELADTIEAMATSIVEFATSGQGIEKNVTGAFQNASLGIAYFIDTLTDARIAYLKLKVVTESGIQPTRFKAVDIIPIVALSRRLGKNIDDTSDSMEKLADIYSAGSRVDRINAFYDSLKNKIEAVGKTSKSTANILSDSFLEISESIGKANDKLQEQIDLFGLTANEAQIEKFRKLGESLSGAELELFNLQLKDTIRLTNELKGIEDSIRAQEDAIKSYEEQLKEWDDELKKMEDFADGIKDSLKGPIDKLKEFRDELDKIRKLGLITQDQFDKALKNRAEELLSGIKDAKIDSLLGIGEAQEIRVAFVDVAGLAMGGPDQMLVKMDAQNVKIDKTNLLLTQVNENLTS